MEKVVLFYKAPLSNKYEDVEKALIDDPILNNEIKLRSQQLAKENIETFKIDKNILVTEKGYYIAIYEK